MKPKLLIIELWGLGDLVIATPFLRAAAEKHDVTLVAKPYAAGLQARLWPGVKVRTFVAPWTAFKGKYRLWRWPWQDLFRLIGQMRREHFDIGLSARWDPRDHFLLWMFNARRRLGFQRLRSRALLTQTLNRPDPAAHRYEHWRTLARELNLHLAPREELRMPIARHTGAVLIHTGAGQPIRVWPLPFYQLLAGHLRAQGYRVVVACDEDQRAWWLRAGEAAVQTPKSVSELLALIDASSAFVGNDSGPGHLAAFCGVPTFTIFGPQLPEWFAPLHPESEWIEGAACPFKPCSDYCRFPEPRCMTLLKPETVIAGVNRFLAAELPISRASTVAG